MNGKQYSSYEELTLNYALNAMFNSMQSELVIDDLKFVRSPLNTSYWTFQIDDQKFIVTCLTAPPKKTETIEVKKPNRLAKYL